MARTRRIKFTDRDALHHVTSRVSGRQMLLAGAGVTTRAATDSAPSQRFRWLASDVV